MTRPAPAHASLLCDFVNTYDVEDDIDDLRTPADLLDWLVRHGLIAPAGAAPSDAGARGAGPSEAAAPVGAPSGAAAGEAAPSDAVAPGSVSSESAPSDAGTSGAAEATGSDADHLATAVALREGLRAAMLANHGPGGALPGSLEDALRDLPLRVSLSSGRPRLVPVEPGVRGAIARLAVAMIEAMADGAWGRLKVCQESTCQWAFLDTSKNRSRTWCSMRVCGNRAKTRAYRARRRTAGSP